MRVVGYQILLWVAHCFLLKTKKRLRILHKRIIFILINLSISAKLHALKPIRLGMFDRSFGVLFGAFKGIFFCYLVFAVLNVFYYSLKLRLKNLLLCGVTYWKNSKAENTKVTQKNSADKKMHLLKSHYLKFYTIGICVYYNASPLLDLLLGRNSTYFQLFWHFLVQDISCQNFKINEVKKRSIKKKPPAPFITSTLQQSA